jgi:hypothetical protein
MAVRKPQPKNPKESVLRMAVLAVQGNPSVMDLPISGFDPSPGSLDLPLKDKTERCSRCGGPAVDRCPECGCPVCEDCLGGAEA